MAVPGFPSGTYDWSMSNAQVILEALDRIRIRGPAITRHVLISAGQSLNLELQRWSNLGINLWRVTSGTINLNVGQELYTLPPQIVMLTELWYRTVSGDLNVYQTDGYGNLITDAEGNVQMATNVTVGNQDQDRIMVPVTRQQYAMIPNKYMLGTPSQYWFQRLPLPQITIWPVPQQAAPTYVLNWFGLQRIMDASLASGETPNVVNRALDALCACMAARLAVKFIEDAKLVALYRADAKEAWDDFTNNDQEMGPIILQPNLSGYGRM